MANQNEHCAKKNFAEFFAGIGLLRMGLERAGWQIAFANESVSGASFLLKSLPLADRVDVLDATQFLTANVYEHSFFKAASCNVTLSKLLERYNEIVSECETEPMLRVGLEKAG